MYENQGKLSNLYINVNWDIYLLNFKFQIRKLLHLEGLEPAGSVTKANPK